MLQLEQKKDLTTKVGPYKTERGYSLFAEQYLEEPIMNESYSPIRAMGSWLIPTICTWKCIPVIDDLDDL